METTCLAESHHESLFRSTAPSMFGPLCSMSFSSPSTQRSIREGRVKTVYQKSSKYSDEPSYRIRQNLQIRSERLRSMLRGIDTVLTC